MDNEKIKIIEKIEKIVKKLDGISIDIADIYFAENSSEMDNADLSIGQAIDNLIDTMYYIKKSR
jgi:hypothetical protein